MIEFTKNDAVKLVEENSMIIPLLLKDGWLSDAIKAPKLGRKALFAQAKELGLKVAGNVKTEVLQLKINEALNGTDGE